MRRSEEGLQSSTVTRSGQHPQPLYESRRNCKGGNAVICTYCRSQNGPEDHRCGRCGRRLTDDAPRRTFPVQTAAVAPALDQLMETAEAPAPVAAPPPGPRLVAMRPQPVVNEVPSSGPVIVQAPLFPLQEVPRTMSSRPSKTPMSPAPSMRRKAARIEQPSLFDSTQEGSRTLPTSVEASICCNAVVGFTGDRAFAAVIDTVVPLLGFAMFAGAFYGITGTLPHDVKSLAWFAGAFAAIMLLYRLMWCVAGFDSPGMQAARLRLLTFDGRRPTRRARFGRIFGGIISTLPLSMGLLWSLADEERLAWHDYMSSTFPARRY